MVSEASTVRDWLRTTWRVSVPDDWLQACIEWIQSENDGVPAAFQELCNLVFEQWLVCDLWEIGASCLPPGLSQHAKHVLNGAYGLQINSMVDVGTSFYSQLQKVKGTENINASVSATQATQPSWEPKPSRMLMMKLTDGAQDIQAMEYQPIPALSASLSAGTKIVVFGNVLCRSGVLMLKSENIRVLGGDVESLVEENTAERILSSSLQHNIDLNVGLKDLPRKTFEVDRRKAFANIPSSNSGQPKQKVASVVESSWQTTVASELNNNSNNRRGYEDMEEIPDDDLVTIATNVDELNTEQWGEEDFDYARAAKVMDCDLEDYRQQMPSSRSSVMNPKSSAASAAANKRLSCTESQQTARANLAKKPKTETDSLAKSSIMDVAYDVDFDDDDFDWQTSLSSVYRAKHKEALPAKDEKEDLQKETKTLSSKLCVKAALTNPQKNIDTSTKNEVSSGRSCPSFADRVGLRSVFSLADDDILCSTSSPQMEDPCLASPAVTARPHPPSLIVKQEDSEIEQRNKTFPVDFKDTRCSDLKPFTYLSHAMNQQCDQVFTIKAYISTLVSRLEHNQGSHWSLVVKINDGSAAVDVLLTNEILTELIGFSAAECMKMRQRAKLDNSVKQKLTEGIQRCQETLVQLSSMMEVELSAGLSMPSVRSFRSVTEDDIEALKQRIEFCQNRFSQTDRS